ncbi:MAG: mevalonate kinase [Candidatus Lokiarchaeota archaeon]
MKQVLSKSPGKVILFGEHAVVYGFPAIASAISSYSTCLIQKSIYEGIEIELSNYDLSHKIKTPNEFLKQFPEKFKHIGICLEMFGNKYEIDLRNIKIKLSSVLYPSSGLGSSASVSVALIKALDSFFNLNLNREDLSNLAFKLEEYVHGTPSGIDNTVCTYGNMIYYQNKKFEFVKPKSQFPILITNTNMLHDTKKAITKIKNLKNKAPSIINAYLNNIGNITNIAKKEIINGDIKQIGDLMNQNQNILEKLEISNPIIKDITSIALQNGAYGSKLTGAGLGGCVISLGKLNVLERINSILRDKGFDGFITKINETGVQIEQQ